MLLSGAELMPWYIVQTKPTCEEQVRLRWEQAGYEVFLPRIRRAIRGQRGATRIRPLFPAYIFVMADFGVAEQFTNIKYTRGVRRILGDGNAPRPVDQAIIDVIRERVDGEGVLEQQMRFGKGDAVRVLSGPLAELVGVLEKPVSAEGRVRILLKVYSKTIRADLSAAEVEKV